MTGAQNTGLSLTRRLTPNFGKPFTAALLHRNLCLVDRSVFKNNFISLCLADGTPALILGPVVYPVFEDQALYKDIKTQSFSFMGSL